MIADYLTPKNKIVVGHNCCDICEGKCNDIHPVFST